MNLKLPQRKPISVMFPALTPLIRTIRTTGKKIEYLKSEYNLSKNNENDPDTNLAQFRVYKHKSLLRRKLGNADPYLQEQKVKNLEIAANLFNNLTIKPGQTFSFWKYLGKPTAERGFNEGMLIDNGKVVIGIGGGLCQIANLLYWICLHSSLTVKEHHHHQVDIFPDSGRVLPFGSGSGVLYNYGDLQFKNNTNYTFTLKVWLDQDFLRGELWSDQVFDNTYTITEEDHYFYYNSQEKAVYRTNKLYKIRMQRQGGKILDKELITHNDSKVLYEVEKKNLREKV
jgi:vancomycin resistance protein VanW